MRLLSLVFGLVITLNVGDSQPIAQDIVQLLLNSNYRTEQTNYMESSGPHYGQDMAVFEEYTPSEAMYRDLVFSTYKSLGAREASNVMIHLLFSRALETLNQMLDITNASNSDQFEIMIKAINMFNKSTEAFAKLLTTTEDFLKVPTDEKPHRELVKAKLYLIKTIRRTMHDFLLEFHEMTLAYNSSNDQSNSKEFIRGEELIVEKTEESLVIIFDSANSLLEQIIKTPYARSSTKKFLAAKVLNVASNNIITFGSIRQQMSAALIDLNEDEKMEIFQKDVSSEMVKDVLETSIKSPYERSFNSSYNAKKSRSFYI